MASELPPDVLILSADPTTVAALRAACGELGIRAEHQSVAAKPGPAPPRLVCLDAALAEMTPAHIALWRRAGAAPPIVWWIADRARDTGASQAWEQGAGAVLARPLWAPELRAQLQRQVTPAGRPLGAGATPSRPGPGPDLQLLLDIQRQLIPLQVPSEIRQRLEHGLQQLFPDAQTQLSVVADDTSAEAKLPRRLIPEDPDAWSRAELPLLAGTTPLARLTVCARDSATYSRAKLQLLETFAYQAAQGLHRTQLYEALSRGKDEWERTFDTIPDAIAILGPDRRVRRVNRSLASALQRQPREVIGTSCASILCRQATDCAGCPVTRALEEATTADWDDEIHCNDRVYDYRLYPLRNGTEAIKGVIAYGRDITRERLLTQGLRHSEKLVTLGQLAAGIAHEINNPLTAVSSYSQLLGMRLEEPKLVESSRRIHQGVERIHRLVQNLMSFTRPGDDPYHPLDLNEIVVKTLSFSRYEITRHETELVEQLQAGLPRVLGSEPQLEQLLVNLLTNARDAVGGRGSISVRTHSNTDRVHLEVIDDGVGVEQAEVDKIFEPFYTTKPVGKGTGLGLFIAAGIAEKHKGQLTLDSQPGRGTRARLTLPAVSS